MFKWIALAVFTMIIGPIGLLVLVIGYAVFNPRLILAFFKALRAMCVQLTPYVIRAVKTLWRWTVIATTTVSRWAVTASSIFAMWAVSAYLRFKSRNSRMLPHP